MNFLSRKIRFFKNRLAEVVDQNIDKAFLALAEQFQNKFIIKDEFIDELRHDISTQGNNLIMKDKTLVDDKLIKRQEKLRNEMEYFEKDFIQLKNEFNKYLSTGE